MTKVEEIRDRITAARKSGDRATATMLSTLLSETKTAVTRQENRDITDEDVSRQAAKTIKGLEQMLEMRKDRSGSDGVVEPALEFELELLRPYAPKKIADDATVEDIISDLISEFPDEKNPKFFLGRVMRAKQGKANAREVSELIEAALQ